jgi:hypothetical protein
MAREPRHGKKALRRLFHSRPQGRTNQGLIRFLICFALYDLIDRSEKHVKLVSISGGLRISLKRDSQILWKSVFWRTGGSCGPAPTFSANTSIAGPGSPKLI